MATLAPEIEFKVAPWKHQGDALRLSWDKEAFALLMEQGTGKTKVIIDTAALLFTRGKIAGVLVVAPDGVQRAWVAEALPAHMCHGVPWRGAWWSNRQSKRQEREIDALYDDHFHGLRVLTINYETLVTKPGRAAAKHFLQTFRCLMVADESHKIKTPAASRTKVTLDLSALAPYRRILTGTPSAGTPVDSYSQYRFLDPFIIGFHSFVAFRAHYCEMESDTPLIYAIKQRQLAAWTAKVGDVDKAREIVERRGVALIAKDPATGRPRFRNLEELAKRTAPYTFRVLKKDCLDLPPKVYQRRWVKLTKEQRQIYDTLKEEFIAEYDGAVMAVPLAITRLTRLQQVVGGFFKVDADAEEVEISGGNPKIAAMLDVLEQAAGKVVIWARFSPELELIHRTIREEYGPSSVVRYSGGISKTRRDADKLRFVQDPDCRFFVSQPQAGGTGLDGLQVADTVIYFSNEFSLITRLQSEDRAHRGGSERHSKVTVIDLEAENSLDRMVIDSLRSKKEVADVITGDNPRGWL